MNLAQMVDRIQREIRDVTHTDIVKDKIFDAIDTWRHERLKGINEKRKSFTLVPSQREYDISEVLGGELLRVDSLVILYNNRPIPLAPVDVARIHQDTWIRTTSLPYYYAIWDDEIWFYPIPNTAYDVEVLAVMDVLQEEIEDQIGEGATEEDAKLSDGFSSAWFDGGRRLIHYTAKALVYGDLLRNGKEEARNAGKAQRALHDLKRRTNMPSAGFQVDPWDL